MPLFHAIVSVSTGSHRNVQDVLFDLEPHFLCGTSWAARAIGQPLEAVTLLHAQPADAVIFSESENGYWSNEEGWGGLELATRFDSVPVNLPLSAGHDARLLPISPADDGPVVNAFTWQLKQASAYIVGDSPVLGAVNIAEGQRALRACWESEGGQYRVEIDLAGMVAALPGPTNCWRTFDSEGDVVEISLFAMSPL